MHKITTDQMNKVIACISASKEAQRKVFEALDLNPYDNYTDEIPEFNVVIYEDEFLDWLDEVRQYPFEPPHFNWSSVMDSECGGLSMSNKRPKPEEIVSKLRQVEVLMGQGMSRLDAIRQIGVV